MTSGASAGASVAAASTTYAASASVGATSSTAATDGEIGAATTIDGGSPVSSTDGAAGVAVTAGASSSSDSNASGTIDSGSGSTGKSCHYNDTHGNDADLHSQVQRQLPVPLLHLLARDLQVTTLTSAHPSSELTAC